MNFTIDSVFILPEMLKNQINFECLNAHSHYQDEVMAPIVTYKGILMALIVPVLTKPFLVYQLQWFSVSSETGSNRVIFKI